MKRFSIGVAVLLCLTVEARGAAADPCKDHLANVLQVAVPRTSFSEEATAAVSATLRDVLGPAYADPCGKNLQINIAFGSDYEVLEWIEKERVDAAIVPNLSLWLLTVRDGMPLRELNAAAAAQIAILAPVSPRPACARYATGQWQACAHDAAGTFNTLLSDIIANKPTTTRVVFASHLSSAGFLDPIELAAKRFADTGLPLHEQEALWEKLFESARFAITPVSVEETFAFAAQEEKERGDLTVVSYPGEETLQRSAHDGTSIMSYREHFVVTARGAAFFAPAFFVETAAGEPPLVTNPLASRLADEHPPRPLEQIARVEPSYGIRTYAFTIDESMRLLQQQQASSGDHALALVLPGGGVKAAYQSRIIDHLYGKGRLQNDGVVPPKPGALAVSSVLGTSGGALLGYFVAQLRANGPYTLTDILWRPDHKTLDAKQVFGATDLPRYFSIVWAFLVFCVLMAVITGRHRSSFYGRKPAQSASWRWRLSTVLAVFILVPVLIRFATGGDDVEHVPVIEGLFYLILTVLVMFADQCLIYTEVDEEDTRPLRWQWMGLAALGGAFVFASFFGVLAASLLKKTVPFWFAFVTLAIIFLGSPLILMQISGRLGGAGRRAIDVLTALVAVVALCALGVPGRLPAFVPHIVALLVLIVLAVVAYVHLQRTVRSRFYGWLLMFFTLFSTAVLCWPDEAADRGVSFTYFTMDAFEKTGMASFLASTGCLLLVLSAMVWVYQSRHYTLKGGAEFSKGLGLLGLHSIITAILLIAAAALLPGRVHNLEMTPSFWIALSVIGAITAFFIISVGPRWKVVRDPIVFLTSEHPNGALLPRRYARMLAVASLSVVWWNVITAPALYGNAMARKYLQATVKRFDDTALQLARQQKPEAQRPRGFWPTTKFVAPTNTLDADTATRYFLFVPDEHPSADLPRRVSGAEWKVYGTAAAGDCAKTITPQCVGFVQDVVFSSGSPFPIFAAHSVTLPGKDRKTLRLIDGGYSNDIPIDAARTIHARQALIVHSSSPFNAEEHEHAGKPALSFSAGMLIRNAQRLPAFMFEQSQAVDRLSRQNLFVVAIAPKLEAGELWPGLAQFDKATIDELIAKAETNLYERVGFVESWGEPRFRFSEQVSAAPAAGVR